MILDLTKEELEELQDVVLHRMNYEEDTYNGVIHGCDFCCAWKSTPLGGIAHKPDCTAYSILSKIREAL